MIDPDKHEFINPPISGLDDAVHRDAYADLKKSGTIKGMTYLGYLRTIFNRNMEIRKKEFAERSIKTRLDLSEMLTGRA